MACERFIGPVAVCPYCGCDAVRPVAWRWLRLTALALAVGGTVLLFVMGAQRETPHVAIDRITPRMDHGYVRILGTVTRKPYVGRTRDVVDYVSFTLADDAGSIRVHAYRDTARALAAGDTMPKADDRISVEGTVGVSRFGEVRLVVRSVDAIRMEKAKQP